VKELPGAPDKDPIHQWCQNWRDPARGGDIGRADHSAGRLGRL